MTWHIIHSVSGQPVDGTLSFIRNSEEIERQRLKKIEQFKGLEMRLGSGANRKTFPDIHHAKFWWGAQTLVFAKSETFVPLRRGVWGEVERQSKTWRRSHETFPPLWVATCCSRSLFADEDITVTRSHELWKFLWITNDAQMLSIHSWTASATMMGIFRVRLIPLVSGIVSGGISLVICLLSPTNLIIQSESSGQKFIEKEKGLKKVRFRIVNAKCLPSIRVVGSFNRRRFRELTRTHPLPDFICPIKIFASLFKLLHSPSFWINLPFVIKASKRENCFIHRNIKHTHISRVALTETKKLFHLVASIEENSKRNFPSLFWLSPAFFVCIQGLLQD